MVSLPSRLQLVAIFTAVLAAGVGAGIWSYHRAEQRALNELTINARRCAAAFSESDLRNLSGTHDDLVNPVYEAAKVRLSELRKVQPGVRFIYIFRYQPATGKVIFLADSEPAESKDVSLPGDVFNEAAQSPGLQAVIANGQPATEGPLKDSFGVWMTGYAAVGLPVTAPGSQMDIVGMDIAAGNWRGELLERAFRSAVYIWLLLGLPLGVAVVCCYRDRQNKTIRMLAEAVEQSRSALLITNKRGRVDYVSNGLCNQTGYDRSDLVGRDWADFCAGTVPPEPAAGPSDAIREGRAWEGEWTSRRKNGEPYPARAMVTPVRDGEGGVHCCITTVEDMTGPKRAAAELRAKGEFLATMGHELRTPLNGIVRFAGLLKETSLMTEQRDYVQTICASSEALLKLSGDLLDYSWLETGRMPLDEQACDPRELVEGVLDLVSAQSAGKDLVLLHRVATDVPPLVEVDPGRLRQVLVNLLGNAVKFTPAGEVAVDVGVRKPDPASAQVVLEFSVRDTGPGIDKADQARLFQPFSQIASMARRQHGGTGLGLVISRSLVRLMGGEITLESAEGKGSVFRFHVSVRSLEAPVAPPALTGRRVAVAVAHEGLRNEIAAVVAAAGGTPEISRPEALGEADLAVVDCDAELMRRVETDALGTVVWAASRTLGLIAGARKTEERKVLRPYFRSLLTKPLHHDALVTALRGCMGPSERARVHPQLGLRLLIVDDNTSNLRLLQGIVATLGCECTVATGGREALEAVVQDDRYDAVLLDLQMPEVDGMEVVRRLRAGVAGEQARKLWITIVTADNRAETRTELFALGCDDFITKPVTVKTCLGALQRVVVRRPSRV